MAKTKDYQELHLELDEVLAELQRPDVHVGQAVKLYEKGLGLIKKMEAYLETAENTIAALELSLATKKQEEK